MKRYAEAAIEIINDLHCERLDYDTEYLPLIDAANQLRILEEIIGDCGLDRLRDLVEADRDGRCIVLPQKTVFELTWDAGLGCNMICPIRIDGEGQCDFCDHGKLFVYERECKQEHIERIGTDVFLTREAAEAALKEQEDCP